MREPFRHGAPPTVTIRGRAGCRRCGRKVYRHNTTGICYRCKRQAQAMRDTRGFHGAQCPAIRGARGRGRHRMATLLSLWERSERVAVYGERAAAGLALFENGGPHAS